MKKQNRSGAVLGVMAFLVSLGAFTATHAEPLGQDKYKHFGVMASAQTVCSTVGRAITDSKWGSHIACFVTLNTMAAAKEAVDRMTPGRNPEVEDIYANLVGSGTSVFLLSVAF